MRIAIMVMAVGLTPLWAQEIKLPASVEKLAEKAEESVVCIFSIIAGTSKGERKRVQEPQPHG